MHLPEIDFTKIDTFYLKVILFFFILLALLLLFSLFKKKHHRAVKKQKTNSSKTPKKSQKSSTKYRKLSDAEKLKKGQEYEKFISDYYRSLKYKVREHGKIMGKKDQGIDVIAKNKRETILIQCKNFHANTAWKIQQKDIKAFRMDCIDFINENPQYRSKHIRALFVTSNDILDYGAKKYIEEKKKKGKNIDYQTIPLPSKV